MLLPDGQACVQMFQIVATLSDGTILKDVRNAKTERQAMLKFLRDLGTEMRHVAAIDAEAVA
jgi:hypothetical protein